MTGARAVSSLQATLSGQRVGSVERNRSGLASWTPDPEWERKGQRPRLGIAFLRTPGPRQAGTGLPAWFENLLPERGSALRQRLCAAHGVREADGFRLLGAIGTDLSGAVEVLPTGADPAGAEPERAAADGEESPAAARLRFSLAGMQLKLSMSMASERLVLDTRGPGGQWIVKLPGILSPELPEVEAATMTWARNAGFDVPTHFTVEIERLSGVPSEWLEDATRAFAVRRFDRREDGSKIHQEDLCQALELLPIHKYGEVTPQRISFDGALRFVADVAGEDQAKEMARRMGFVIASGNDDAHLKNWSLLWGNADRPVLTPCYDFVATVSWADRHGWRRQSGPALALALGGESLFSRISETALEQLARNAGFGWARDEVITGIERARDAWELSEAEMPPVMREALHEHWQRVPVLRDMPAFS